MKANCYDCIYRGSVPGDTHSCCKFPGNKTGLFDFLNETNTENMNKLHIQATQYGVLIGWFIWPINFDPVWIENCDGFTPK